MSKEKQTIKAIAKDLCDIQYKGMKCRICYGGCECHMLAEALYNTGYRKQSEGEWETIPDYQPNKLIAYRHICSECKTTYKDIRPHGHKFCHECGAKMKGGEE